MRHIRYATTAAAVALLVAGCGQKAAPSPFKPTASFQDIMVSVIDPAADLLWDSVSSEITKAGVVEKRPHTDEEWLALRHQAVALVEAANLLVIDGRPIVAFGKALDNKAGYLNPEDIRKALESTRPAFVQRAHEFQDAAAQALAAIDAKDPEAVVEAGAHIQVACEQCHLRYWYPNGGPPSISEFKAKSNSAGSPRP
jgi:hypothetical protein